MVRRERTTKTDTDSVRRPFRSARQIARRPSWKDPRLAVGILLVAASVALGTYLMRAVDSRVDVWAAARTLTPGTELGGNVVAAQVHEDVAHLYLPATARPEGSVTRTIGDGELIARSATSSDTTATMTRSVVLPLGTELPEHAKRGAVVDVWFIPKAAPGRESSDPHIIAPGATVEQIHSTDGLSMRGFGSIEVSVDQAHVAAVLRGLADQGMMAIVPQGGAL